MGLKLSSSQQPADEGSSKNNKSYDPSYQDAPPTASMDAFQTGMRDAFEQFYLTQDNHGIQLADLVESSHWYTNELAH